MSAADVGLNVINDLLIVTFLIWSIFFYEDFDLGFLRGVLYLIVTLVGFAIVYFLLNFVINLVPLLGLFGTPLIPYLFEWWEHDLWFGTFTEFATYLTIFLFLSEVFILIAVYREAKREDNGVSQ